MNTSRRPILLAFLITIAASIGLLFLMNALQPSLIRPEGTSILPDFWPTWLKGVQEGNIGYRILWFFGDWTEGPFLKSVPAALLMLICAFIAYRREKAKNPRCGTGVGGNCHIWPQILAASFGGLVLCQLAYGSFFSHGWIPTFTPMFSVGPALILTFGGDLKRVLTSILFAGLLPFPISYALMIYFTDPLGLPAFIAGAFGMTIATIIATEICRLLPWMKKEEVSDPPPLDSEAAIEETSLPQTPPSGVKLYVNRLFADINELTFWGSSYGGFGLYVGAIIAWLINPMHGSYSTGRFPVMFCAQICTTALAIFIWYPRYIRNGFAFTFPAIVLTGSIVNSYPVVWQIVVPTVILSAFIMPWFVDWLLKVTKYSGRWHICCYALFSIGFVCIFWSLFVMKVLMPYFAG